MLTYKNFTVNTFICHVTVSLAGKLKQTRVSYLVLTLRLHLSVKCKNLNYSFSLINTIDF